MKTISDRYEELNHLSNRDWSTMSAHIEDDNYCQRIFYNTICKEYFGDTLTIELLESKEYGWLLEINGEIRNYSHVDKEDLEYLQRLYDLQSLKRKIEKVNEIY